MDARVMVRVDEVGAGAERVDRLVCDLRAELLRLDVDAVRRDSSDLPAPPGSRGLDVTSLNALLVTATSSAALFGSITQVLLSWVKRDSSRKAELTIGDRTIALEGISAAQQDRLIEEFLVAVSEQG
jgi:hypothetical protein